MIIKFIKIHQRLCLTSIIFLCIFHNNYVLASNEPLIRVLVSRKKNIRIRSDRSIPLILKSENLPSKKIRGFTIKDVNSKKVLFFDKNKQKKYDLENKQRFKVKSIDSRGIWVGQKRYSGELNLYILPSEILVVNVLGIEKYLSSVVGSEMPTKWPMEALKAQAIASRTYALKQKGNLLYDIDSTQKNQVYNGLESRTIKTRKAVRSTRSLVLTYKNKLINALFHSSSGGITENSQDVWKNKHPYLSSVKDFDSKNPKLRWKKRFSNEQLQNLFPEIGVINNIKVLNITNTGRIENAKIFGEYGSYKMSGVDLRKKLNLKSTLIRFKFIEDQNKNNTSNKKSLLVIGMGSGHGVGMSQWGAKNMASMGLKAERILKYFYRGVVIKPFKKDYL